MLRPHVLPIGLAASIAAVALGVVLFYRTSDPNVLWALVTLGLLLAGGTVAAWLAKRSGASPPAVLLRCRECRQLNPEGEGACRGCGAAL